MYSTSSRSITYQYFCNFLKSQTYLEKSVQLTGCNGSSHIFLPAFVFLYPLAMLKMSRNRTEIPILLTEHQRVNQTQSSSPRFRFNSHLVIMWFVCSSWNCREACCLLLTHRWLRSGRYIAITLCGRETGSEETGSSKIKVTQPAKARSSAPRSSSRFRNVYCWGSVARQKAVTQPPGGSSERALRGSQRAPFLSVPP